MTMTPEMQKAVRDVQVGYAKAAKRRALDSVKKSLEANADVIQVRRRRSGDLIVEMKSGIVLRIERF